MMLTEQTGLKKSNFERGYQVLNINPEIQNFPRNDNPYIQPPTAFEKSAVYSQSYQ